MKKITYQITLSDDAYIECIGKIHKLMLFPDKGNMEFKVEDVGEDDSQAIIVDGVMYSSYEDYIKSREENKSGRKG